MGGVSAKGLSFAAKAENCVPGPIVLLLGFLRWFKLSSLHVKS